MENTLPNYDRSLLPDALFEFVVMGDTHFILDPEPYAVEFDSVRQWPQRADYAWHCVAGLQTDFVVHLGDMTEENAARLQQPESRKKACEQFETLGLKPYHVAGNMDIGDKPDRTMWTEWVTPESLAIFHERFGPSWYSFDHKGVHFVVLNSQIMNGPLPEVQEQQAWAEADLEAHRDMRKMVFMHMPPFFVEETEPDTGFYNSINEPARGWITDLLRKYQVDCLFTGHTHFRAFNRVDETRFYVSPSTTTSRAGFYEAFSVAPAPEQGRNDPAKLGFYLVRVYEDRVGAYFIRTHGHTKLREEVEGLRIVCGKTMDLPDSPLGIYMRTPLASQSVGALAWPSILRQRVRDDHPFLHLLEAGVRHVRVPVSDLQDDLQSTRLQMLREEGVSITAVWLWSERLDLVASVGAVVGQVDTVELQVPGELFPDKEILESLVQCRERYGKPVVLTPIIAREATEGKYHPRTRFGYRIGELDDLDRHLKALKVELDRVVCHIDSDDSPWKTMKAFGALQLDCIGGFDYVVRLPGIDEAVHQRYVAEALLAIALQPENRLFLDPFVDLDRTNDLNLGLLDRLSNPRAAYSVMQRLNTVLFSQEVAYTPLGDGVAGVASQRQRHWLVTSEEDAADFEGKVNVVDLIDGLYHKGAASQDTLAQVIKNIEMPCLITEEGF